VTISWIKPESSGSSNLLSSRDALSTGHCDERTAAAITNILAGPKQGQNDAAGTLEKLQVLLEQIRHTPKGIARVSRMNAFVRTLGRADNLANFLELMRTSLKSSRLSDHKIAERSRAGLTHCLYGWAGQSHVLYSERNPLPATTLAGNGVEDHMGYPVAEWRASIHIWQPNPEAQAFKSLKRFEPGVLVEPPHSHPFSFVSYVSIGVMRESVYKEASASAPAGSAGRYEELAHAVRSAAGSSAPIRFIDRPEDDPIVRRPSITLADHLLGWKAETALNDGLRRTIAWFRDQLTARE